MTQRRCMGCGHFHSAKDKACPECGKPKSGFSKHLRTSMLNNALYAQAEKA